MKGGEKGQWLPPYPWTLVCHSGWWHQPPGLQRPVHFTPYNCFPAWAGGSALDSKTTPPPARVPLTKEVWGHTLDKERQILLKKFKDLGQEN